ncbi:putative glucooligosaccharide oxidase [Delitschia confertaspora ATCC 74209]|uniref:Glucooligosaccharide oxidase n=1 Tax=Delitschia confertaspora ATCC 74209 TaxID=1513339 RepID=A0A9P4MX07_9PLEO|nr:putative glucooligosaccharide oxidase [Delitschia confertaspora ATCC 74209]
MGNTASAVENCLIAAVGGNIALLATPSTPLYIPFYVKPYNLDYPTTPIAVTYPQTAEQIAAIVKCAANTKIKVQARCGGHSYANYGIGGQDSAAIVVDMKNFKQFSMDTTTWQATVGGGTLLGDLTRQMHNAGGRAMAHGTCPQVGIGGHATIGGLGPTSRMWGAALDHILEVEVVLANSSIVRASEKQNSDVFWAIKGAGAGFGIVTEFKVRTQKEPGEAVMYQYNIHAGDAVTKAKSYKAWQKWASDPDLDRRFASQFIISELGVIVYGTFFGTKAEFDAVNPSSRFPDSSDSIQVKDWLGAVTHWAEDLAQQIGGSIPAHFYSKSFAFTKNDMLSDEAIDKLFAWIDKTSKGTPLWFIIWDLEGGAINDIPADETAYGHRDTLFYTQSYGVNLFGQVTGTINNFIEGFNKNIQDSLPGHDLGAYPGYVDPKLANGQQAYWGANYPRLQQIKRAVDPNDVFSNPQSVRPAKA